MATSNPPTSERPGIEPPPQIPRETRDTRESRRDTRDVRDSRESRAWGLPLAIGVLMILAGAFALYASVLTSLVSVLFLGITLMAVGIAEIVSAIRHRHREPFIVYFMVGLLSFVIGVLFVARPLVGLATLTFVIAGFMFASGLFRAITAISTRYPHWGWDLLSGAVAIGLGIYIVATFPISALWLLGTLVAIDIIVRGATLIAASTIVRDIDRGRAPAMLAHA